MSWRKLGRLFEPTGAEAWMVSHASVPIAERLSGNVYRVYFSSRDHSKRSHTGFFEFDISNPDRVLRVSPQPVLSPGAPGDFDDSGAMASCIVNHHHRLYMYYIGWNLGATVPFRNAIGVAISDDGGRTFTKRWRGPILDRSIFDPAFTGGCHVLVESGLWRMWYLSCMGWEMKQGQPVHRYHIKYAASSDGVDWRRDGTVCIDFQSGDEYAIARPCVLVEDGRYRMWYCYRGQSYRIGYAESLDGRVWQRRDKEAGIDVSQTGWDSEMIEYPFVFVHDGTRYMLYNGNGYGETGIGLAVEE